MNIPPRFTARPGFAPPLGVWLDDLRDPQDPAIQRNYGARGDEVWCKTVAEAEQLIFAGGMPVARISFDHDLGEGKTGYDLARAIESAAHEGRLESIRWTVHSANPVGRARIEVAMRQAEKFWAERGR